MKKEKLIATINKEEDSHCRKAAVLQLNILLYNSRLQITILNSQPLVSAQNENPSECLPSVTAHWAPAGLHLLLCRYSITTQPQPQLSSTGLRFLVIGHQVRGQAQWSLWIQWGWPVSNTHFAGIVQLLYIY